MGQFKHEEIVGPEAEHDGVPESGRSSERRSGPPGDANAGDERPIDAEDSLPSMLASAGVTLLKENRSLAIFGAFALGVIIGSLSKS